MSCATWNGQQVKFRSSDRFPVFSLLFASGEIYNDLYVSGIELLGGYFLAVAVAIPLGIMVGWYKRMSYVLDPFINAMNATPWLCCHCVW